MAGGLGGWVGGWWVAGGFVGWAGWAGWLAGLAGGWLVGWLGKIGFDHQKRILFGLNIP